MIINNITLPFSTGDKAFTFFFSIGSVVVVSFDIDSVCISDAGDEVAHVRAFLKSDQHYISSKDVSVLGFNDKLMVTSEGVYFFNQGNAQQKIVDYKTANFTIPS